MGTLVITRDDRYERKTDWLNHLGFLENGRVGFKTSGAS